MTKRIKRTGQACKNPHCERTDRYKTKRGYQPPFYVEAGLCHRCYMYMHTVMKRTPTWVMQRNTTVDRWKWLLDIVRPKKASRPKGKKRKLRAA